MHATNRLPARARWLALLLVLGAGACTPAAPTAASGSGVASSDVSTSAAASGSRPAAGTSGAAASRGSAHVLKIGDSQSFDSLNPHLDSSISTAYLAQLTQAFLIRYDARNEPVPELATVIPTMANGGIAADGKTITFHLRHGVRWSDGKPFTADDALFSTRVVLNPANNEVSRDGWNLIDRMAAPDPYTVVYHVRKPYADFVATFFASDGGVSILPKHLLGGLANINNAPYSSKPVGIGPFRVVQWVRGDHVTLEANPYYWNGRPKLARIIVKLLPDANTALVQLQTGEINALADVGPGYLERVRALPGVSVDLQPQYGYAHIDFNLTNPLFADLRVRRALRLGLNRSEIIRKLYHGAAHPQEGVLPPVDPVATTLPFIAYDPAKADTLLEAAGWKRGADGIRAKGGQRLAFTYAIPSGTSLNDQMAALVVDNWKAIGAEVSVRRYQSAIYFAQPADGGILSQTKFDTAFWVTTSDPGGDMASTFACANITPKGQNDQHFCDPALDAKMEIVKTTYDEAKRRRYVREVLQDIDDAAPTIVLYARSQIQAYHTKVTGWHPNAITPVDDFLNVDA